jgi:hypothetical protein
MRSSVGVSLASGRHAERGWKATERKAMYRGIQHPELNILPFLPTIYRYRELGYDDLQIAIHIGWEVEEMRVHLTAWDDCDG